MNKTITLIAVITISATMMTSCLDESDALYSETTMGNIESGKFVTDAGLTYTFTHQNCDGRIDTLKRAIVACDVLEKTSETTYNACLNSFAPVMVRAPRRMSAYSDEVLGTDAINLAQGWFSGGYLNAFYYISAFSGSSTVHTIDLAFNDVRSSKSDTLFFELRHNGYGEVFDNVLYGDAWVIASGYASFPIDQLIPSGKSSAPVSISWSWYRQTGDAYITEREPKTEVTIYSRD